MTLNKPQFWDKKLSVLSIVFFPFSLIVIGITIIKKKFSRKKKFKIPIICVGNIYIGGTGKTPTCILLAKELTRLGRNPTILKKFYKNHADEHALIRKNFKNLILTNNRIDGLKKAEEMNFDCAILDDGFQDYGIKKDLNLICFSNEQQIGNGFVLPAGPLRENLKSLVNANIVLINGGKDKTFEDKILKINSDIEFFYTEYKPINLDQFRNMELLALAGIGNPKNFFKLLKKNGLQVKKERTFPDHYRFKDNEILEIINEADKNNYQIIMTEKDYYRIRENYREKIKYLEVSLEIQNKEKLLKKLNII